MKAKPKKFLVGDWNLFFPFRFVTGHRLRVLFWTSLSIFLIYKFQDYMWPIKSNPIFWHDIIWSKLSFLCIVVFPAAIFSFIGLIWYKFPKNLENIKPIENKVCFRIVSRGGDYNTPALIKSIRSIQDVMKLNPVYPYVIEVVTDLPVEIPAPNFDIIYICVPKSYQTVNGTKFKARALHYAMLNSKIPNKAWIVHLDEETHLTLSGSSGICKMIQEEEKNGRLRIGQGAITYHRNMYKHPILTLADNVRTGMDFGPFYLQTKFGISFIGLHGSYIVIRNDIEKSTGGFDFGPAGNTTEDAYWALIANSKGHRIRWVEGYLSEQSTHSVKDFIYQRCRWMTGLIKVVLFVPVPIRYRIGLGFTIILWLLSYFSNLYIILHLFHGFEFNHTLRFVANFIFGTYVMVYMVGLKTNMDEYGIKNPFERFFWYILQFITIPILSALELLGGLKTLIAPDGAFHVVKKS